MFIDIILTRGLVIPRKMLQNVYCLAARGGSDSYLIGENVFNYGSTLIIFVSQHEECSNQLKIEVMIKN